MAKPAEKPRYNVENLKTDFSPEELSANGRKGGVASGKTRRAQRTFRESINAILSCPVQDESVKEALEVLGLDPTVLNEINLAVISKGRRGDVEAARFIRDTKGEKPREGVDLDIETKPLASLDMSKMTDEQLRALAAQRAEKEGD